MGWDNVDGTSLGVRYLPTLYQPCRFCLLGVWISWFVGVGWTFLYPQRAQCGLDHRYLDVGIRSKPAKLISGHHYFIASRYRRTTSCTFQRCNRCFQVKPFFCKHPNLKNRNLHGFKRNDCFLHRHPFPFRRMYRPFDGSLGHLTFIDEFQSCIKKGVKLQAGFLWLAASFYICQIHLFAANWMKFTSVDRMEWFAYDGFELSSGYRVSSRFPRSLVRRAILLRRKQSACNISTPNACYPCRWSTCDTKASGHKLQVFDQKGCWTSFFQTPLLYIHDMCFNPLLGVRVGEAKNPGPDAMEFLDIGTFNPTQLLHKEDDIIQWGRGIYTACETSMTPIAHQITNGKFRRAGWFTRWSQFVSPQQPKTSQLRGKAGGTAILSTFPLKPYVEPCPEILRNSERFCEGIAQVHCNTNLYISAMYGFPIANAYLNALQMNNDLFSPIAERALNFQGPAIITGDFNCDLKDLVAWRTLQSAGWHDAALLDSRIHNRAPQPTCREATRRSFILVNAHIAARLDNCRTCDDFLFSCHPLLLAKVNFQNLIQPQLMWTLPKATDDLMFDNDLQTQQVQNDLQTWGNDFDKALETHDADKAANLFARLVQNSWVASNVDVEGNHLHLQQKYLGRDCIQLLRKRQCSIPVVRKGRDGDFEPIGGQTNISIRRHTRQLRRLETLVLQVRAKSKSGVKGANQKCQELWESILGATGFHKSFSWWIGENLGWFVPQFCPHVEYLESLKDTFRKWHNHESYQYYLHRQRVRRISVALDAEKGGRLAFQELKDPPLAPLTFLTKTVESQVVKVKWPKQGLRKIRLGTVTQFDINLPVHFQNQTVKITGQAGSELSVDPPLKLRDQNMTITQHDSVADPSRLQGHLAQAWNQHWIRDHPPDDWVEEWKDIGPLLEHLPDLPTKAFQPCTIETWKKHCKNLNKRSSRGGCGFSVVEMLSFPPILVRLLFKIFEACEHGMPWPSRWVTAKVCMLSKCDNPKSPFDARPITVFGVLYRQWSRIRSREILQYMASFMPVELAASTKGVAADAVACLITHIAETAVNRGESMCGIGIDLTRCFNTLPRYPIILALRKLGVPEAYISAWDSMLRCMTRTLTVGNSQSILLPSTTGAPEGCGMSVVAMACITYWCGRFILDRVPPARPICYADNWNVLSNTPKFLLDAIKCIEFFVQKL